MEKIDTYYRQRIRKIIEAKLFKQFNRDVLF